MKKLFLFFLILASFSGRAFAATSVDYYNAGMTFYKQNQFQSAITYFKAAIQLTPNDFQSYGAMAQAYYALGKYNEAYDACGKSLDIYPDNPPIEALQKKLIPIVIVAPPVPTKATAGSRSGRPEGPPMDPKLWFKLSFNAGYSLEEDFNNGVRSWNVAMQQSGATTQKASAGNWGVGPKLEVGNPLDSENALTFAFSVEELDGFTGSANNAAATISEKISPLVLGLEMDFCRFWPSEKSRFYLKGGIGYYYAFVYIAQSVQGAYGGGNYSPESGTVGNGDFGFNLGAGYELKMGKDLGVELSLEGRFAAISELNLSSNGIVLGLAELPNGYIGVVDTKTLLAANSGRFLTIDLTGVDLGISLIHYIF